eukprot:snap_masked-scaffold_38-processed-gene-2.61-mRNA-1 protein AED:1.00 eAED:1.00 QI:0/-1/0/0/-1/1/1/0/683
MKKGNKRKKRKLVQTPNIFHESSLAAEEEEKNLNDKKLEEEIRKQEKMNQLPKLLPKDNDLFKSAVATRKGYRYGRPSYQVSKISKKNIIVSNNKSTDLAALTEKFAADEEQDLKAGVKELSVRKNRFDKKKLEKRKEELLDFSKNDRFHSKKINKIEKTMQENALARNVLKEFVSAFQPSNETGEVKNTDEKKSFISSMVNKMKSSQAQAEHLHTRNRTDTLWKRDSLFHPRHVRSFEIYNAAQTLQMYCFDVIKVEYKLSLKSLVLIERVAEFVSLHGEDFESALMQNEKDNEEYSFLYPKSGEKHHYYRYRAFLHSNGCTFFETSNKVLQMFTSDRFVYTQDSSNSVNAEFKEYFLNLQRLRSFKQKDDAIQANRKSMISGAVRPEQQAEELSVVAKREFQLLLDELSGERKLVKEVMAFCYDFAAQSEEIFQIFDYWMVDALGLHQIFDDAEAHKMVVSNNLISCLFGYLFSLSDIAENAAAAVKKSGSFRPLIEKRLPLVFLIIRRVYFHIQRSSGRFVCDAFARRISYLLEAWEERFLFPKNMVSALRLLFHSKDQGEKMNLLVDKEFSSLDNLAQIEVAKLLEQETNRQAIENSKKQKETEDEHKPKVSETRTTVQEVEFDSESDVSKISVEQGKEEKIREKNNLSVNSQQRKNDFSSEEESITSSIDGEPLSNED